MLSAYPACFFKEENKYTVIFPDLNCLSTCGDTLNEAFTIAVDCLAGYLYWLQKDNEPAPPASLLNSINPSDIAKEIEINPEEAFVNMITVDVAEYAKAHFEKSVKKTLTIPFWLNERAMSLNVNFSQVLQEALLEKIHALSKAD